MSRPIVHPQPSSLCAPCYLFRTGCCIVFRAWCGASYALAHRKRSHTRILVTPTRSPRKPHLPLVKPLRVRQTCTSAPPSPARSTPDRYRHTFTSFLCLRSICLPHHCSRHSHPLRRITPIPLPRSHIRRNRAPVHSDGCCPAPVYLMIYCSPYLASVLYPFSLCFSLVFGSRACVRVPACSLACPFPFRPSPSRPVFLSTSVMFCAPLFPRLFVCSLLDSKASHSLVIHK